jgi:hypothetical protein
LEGCDNKILLEQKKAALYRSKIKIKRQHTFSLPSRFQGRIENIIEDQKWYQEINVRRKKEKKTPSSFSKKFKYSRSKPDIIPLVEIKSDEIRSRRKRARLFNILPLKNTLGHNTRRTLLFATIEPPHPGNNISV